LARLFRGAPRDARKRTLANRAQPARANDSPPLHWSDLDSRNEFVTDAGAVTLVDFMPISRREQRTDVVRIVRGLRGAVPMRMEMTARFDYGHVVPWLAPRDYGLRAIAGPDALSLRTPIPIRNDPHTASCEFAVGVFDVGRRLGGPPSLDS